MFAKIPERYMHRTRWVLAVGWLILIGSLFYDPWTVQLTNPNTSCVMFQGGCMSINPYPLGVRIWWTIVIPLVIGMLIMFGHDLFRRICPLAFFSELGRRLGFERPVIQDTSWYARNHLSVQYALLFLGLTLRLLLLNNRLLLGIFLIATILTAIAMGFCYGGKTFCMICPMGPVHEIFGSPRGIFSSKAHLDDQPTGSSCRREVNGKDELACVGCVSNCVHIDSELSYWESINRADSKLRYAYVGLVAGFVTYMSLFSGNQDFVRMGAVWQEDQITNLWLPGFFILGNSIQIPKIIAVPLWLGSLSFSTLAIGVFAETAYKQHNQSRNKPLLKSQITHRAYQLAAFIAFNLYYWFSVEPTLSWLPLVLQHLLSWAAVIAISYWLFKNWGRSKERYARETQGKLSRDRLQDLPFDFSQLLNGRSFEDLNSDELYSISTLVPKALEERLQVYKEFIRMALEQGMESSDLKLLKNLRQQLHLSEKEHEQILQNLRAEYPDLFTPKSSKTGSENHTKQAQKGIPTNVKSAQKAKPKYVPTVRRS